MSNSYRTLIERLRQFANGHYIIQKFYHGQIDAADLDKEPRYPMMHVLPVDIRASEGTLDYALEIRFADIGRDKEIKTDYQKEIISDMSRIALSLISEIENGEILFGEDAEIVDKQATIIPFIEEFTHVLTGVQLNVTIRLPFNWSACDIPADYSPNITDNPTTGSGILTKIGIYNDGAFVGYTSFVDFSDDFNVTVNGNKIEVTLAGGGGGGGTLQETTDLGNTTTNDIEFIDAAEVIFGAGGGVLLDNASRLREGTIDANTGGSKGIAQICGVGYELKWEAGSQYVMNGSGDNIRIVNHKFNIAPVVTDDSSSGFYVGSRWILDDGVSYICTDATIGAAVWEVEVLPYIPLAGTDSGSPVTGDIEISDGVNFISNDGSNSVRIAFLPSSLGDGIRIRITDGVTPISYKFPLVGELSNDSVVQLLTMKSRIWTKAGTPTTTNDSTEGYLVGSLIWDTTNSILYKCTDNTGGAAVWAAAIAGGGDMFKSVYDTDNDGIVDKAETVQIIVRNSTGSTLTKGQVVYLSGATGNRPNAVLAQADSEATSSKTIGIVTANIANNSDGNIAVNGTLHDLNTNSFTAGDAVWLSATTAGAFTVTPPAEPNHTVFIGYIARAHPTQGRIVIAIQNGYELNELHGVSVPSPSNGQVLTYNSTSGLWENQTITYTDIIRAGTIIGTGLTRWLVPGLSGFSAAVVANIAEKAIHTTFRVMTATAQPASGSLTITRQFTDVIGTVLQNDVLTIPAGSAIGEYNFSGSTYNSIGLSTTIKFICVNNSTTSSAYIQGVERSFTK